MAILLRLAILLSYPVVCNLVAVSHGT